jgi:hypothetical protein
LKVFESDVISNGTWRVINPDGAITWSLSPVGGNTPGNQAMKLDFFNYTQSGERDKLISPRISLNGFSSASLNFEHAYRRFNQSATDSLIVYVSNDCGETWVRIMQVGENGSGTFATNSLSQTPFTPALPLDWCIEPWSFSVPGSSCYNLNLSIFLGDDIFIMFESYNAGSIGNNLFIDNINIEGTQIQGFPEVNFSLSSSIICEGENVQFTDISGPDILSRLWNFPGGAPSYSTLENPVISYDYQGAYDVSLSVSNVNGSNSITQNNLIIVYPKPQSPIIVQSGNELSVDLQLGQTASWFINGVQLSNNESFSIDTAGNYYVQVTNSFGCMTQSDNFNVLNLEKINPKVFWEYLS